MTEMIKASVYIIYSTKNPKKVYVGSTEMTLEKRFKEHKWNYICWKRGNTTKCTSFILFDEYGVESCEIKLYKEYELLDETHLHTKEFLAYARFKIDGEVVNRQQPFSGYKIKALEKEYRRQYNEKNRESISEYHKQYREEHKESILEKKRQYYEENKESILQYQKQHYEENKESILQYHKQHYEENKKSILEKQKDYRARNKEWIAEKGRKEKITCGCGSVVRKSDLAKHKRSMKHQNWLLQQKENEQTEQSH